MANTSSKAKLWVQRSKVLASWSLIIFGIIAVLSLAAFSFLQFTDTSADGMKTVITSATTLAGVVITGYMGNSGLEKYTERKCKMEELLNKNESLSESEEGNL